jgi:hypothetical protein
MLDFILIYIQKIVQKVDFIYKIKLTDWQTNQPTNQLTDQLHEKFLPFCKTWMVNTVFMTAKNAPIRNLPTCLCIIL